MITAINTDFSTSPDDRRRAFSNIQPPSKTHVEIAAMTDAEKASYANVSYSYQYVSQLTPTQINEAVNAPYFPGGVSDAFYHKSLTPGTATSVIHDTQTVMLGPPPVSCELLVIIGHGNDEYLHGGFTPKDVLLAIQFLNPKAVILGCCDGLEFGVNLVKQATADYITCPPVFGPIGKFLKHNIFSMQQFLAPLAGLCVHGGKITSRGGNTVLGLPHTWSEEEELDKWAQMFAIAERMEYGKYFYHCTEDNLATAQRMLALL